MKPKRSIPVPSHDSNGGMDAIPYEILLKIFSFLDIPDLLSVGYVNICSDNTAFLQFAHLHSIGKHASIYFACLETRYSGRKSIYLTLQAILFCWLDCHYGLASFSRVLSLHSNSTSKKVRLSGAQLRSISMNKKRKLEQIPLGSAPAYLGDSPMFDNQLTNDEVIAFLRGTMDRSGIASPVTSANLRSLTLYSEVDIRGLMCALSQCSPILEILDLSYYRRRWNVGGKNKSNEVMTWMPSLVSLTIGDELYSDRGESQLDFFDDDLSGGKVLFPKLRELFLVPSQESDTGRVPASAYNRQCPSYSILGKGFGPLPSLETLAISIRNTDSHKIFSRILELCQDLPPLNSMCQLTSPTSSSQQISVVRKPISRLFLCPWKLTPAYSYSYTQDIELDDEFVQEIVNEYGSKLFSFGLSAISLANARMVTDTSMSSFLSCLRDTTTHQTVNLEFLCLKNTKITSVSLRSLSSSYSVALVHLDLCGCKWIDDRGLAAVLEANIDTLRNVNLKGCTAISGAVLVLDKSKCIETLVLDRTSCSKAVAEKIWLKCPSLRLLFTHGSKLFISEEYLEKEEKKETDWSMNIYTGIGPVEDSDPSWLVRKRAIWNYCMNQRSPETERVTITLVDGKCSQCGLVLNKKECIPDSVPFDSEQDLLEDHFTVCIGRKIRRPSGKVKVNCFDCRKDFEKDALEHHILTVHEKINQILWHQSRPCPLRWLGCPTSIMNIAEEITHLEMCPFNIRKAMDEGSSESARMLM